MRPNAISTDQKRHLAAAARQVASRMRHPHLLGTSRPCSVLRDGEACSAPDATPRSGGAVLPLLVDSYIEEVAGWAVKPCNVGVFLAACFEKPMLDATPKTK